MSVPKTSSKDDPLRATNPTQGNRNACSGRINFSSIKYLKGKKERKRRAFSYESYHETPELAPGRSKGGSALWRCSRPHGRLGLDAPVSLRSRNSGPGRGGKPSQVSSLPDKSKCSLFAHSSGAKMK